MPDFGHEAAVTERLLGVLGVWYSHLVNPLVKYARQTGADVEIERSGRKIGIQATDFSIDEGIVNPRRNLRATERRNARQRKVTTYSIPHRNQRAALRRRIAAKLKIAARHDFKEFGEVWLLVAAMLARDDAVASTSILPQFLRPDDLNRDFDEALRRSNYAHAFIHIQVYDTVYEWTPEEAWRLVRCTAPDPQPTDELRFMRYLREPELVGEVLPHPKVIERSCAVCGGPFTREQPRSEPARTDGRYVHSDEAECARVQRITVWRVL